MSKQMKKSKENKSVVNMPEENMYSKSFSAVTAGYGRTRSTKGLKLEFIQ
jgi:hypothetical protein